MEQKQPINNGKNLIVKNFSFCLIVFSIFEVNQSIGTDTRASYSSITVNENIFYERNLTTTATTTTAATTATTTTAAATTATTAATTTTTTAATTTATTATTTATATTATTTATTTTTTTTTTTAPQSSTTPSCPLLKRRRIHEPIARSTISDNSLYFDARNMHRPFREFNNQTRRLSEYHIFIINKVKNSIYSIHVITSKFKYDYEKHIEVHLSIFLVIIN
jgi:hypothetical protein